MGNFFCEYIFGRSFELNIHFDDLKTNLNVFDLKYLLIDGKEICDVAAEENLLSFF